MNDDLNKLRRKIDNLDKDLVKILNKRAELAKTIKKIKDMKIKFIFLKKSC